MTTNTLKSTRYWVSTVSLDQVRRDVSGGFVQVEQRVRTRLARLGQGDQIAFYSPKFAHPDGAPLQQFTALGEIVGREPYQVRLDDGSEPWRLGVRFAECLAVPIRPLLPELGFITDQQHWGMVFRRGLFEIPCADFHRIAGAMRAQELLAG